MANNNSALITLIRATKDEIEEEYKEIIEGQIIFNTTDKTISCDEKNRRVVYVGNQIDDAITSYILETTYNSETKKHKTQKAYYKGEYVLFEGNLYFVNDKVNEGYEFTLQDLLDTKTSFIPTTISNEIKNLKNGVPFKFGVDANGDYGYYKQGENTITPFKNRHTEIFKPTSRANNLDMGLYHKNRYVDTTNVPNNNTEVYTATTNGTHDMGTTNNNRYVNVNVTPHLVGTYSAPTNIDVSAYPNGQFIAVPVSGGYHQTYHHDHVSGSAAGGWIKNQTDYVPPSTSRSGNVLSITPAYLHDTTYYYVLDNFQYPTQVSGDGVEYLATQVYYIG